ncbi:MAG: TlpA family protein disulfide reductase [Planctomycetota bacterium]|jgi:tetratricopeptide (TPR) repeat protein
MTRYPVLLVACLAFAAPLLAEEEVEPGPRGHDEARAAHAWLEATAAYRRGLLDASRTLREAAQTEAEQATQRQAFMDLLAHSSEIQDAARERFREAFEASELDAWDAETDAALLSEGLDLAARHALEHDPERAVSYWDQLIARLPDDAAADRARTTWLPIALPSTGDLARARERLLGLSGDAEEEWRPTLLTAIGDVDAIAGDYEAARAQYEEAMAGIPEAAGRNDPRGRLRDHLALRLRLVGRPAPDIGGGSWFGAEPRTLSDLRGDVVLLDYWATW